MSHLKKRLTGLVLALTMALTVAACGQDDSPTEPTGGVGSWVNPASVLVT